MSLEGKIFDFFLDILGFSSNHIESGLRKVNAISSELRKDTGRVLVSKLAYKYIDNENDRRF